MLDPLEYSEDSGVFHSVSPHEEFIDETGHSSLGFGELKGDTEGDKVVV
jgi:hypothetical protein